MKKLAIINSGAVSLGAYEAGVLYELLQAITAHNAADPANAILIDVIAGASAGGMNSAILAQKLLFQADRLTDPADNDLYLPWVRDVDLTSLLAMNPNEPTMQSILSSDLIDAISTRYMINPYYVGMNLQNNSHPAAAPKIRVGLAMSNLNGVTYELPLASGGNVPYTRFQDEVKFEVDPANPDHDTPDFWEPIRAAAVACGAFPFAFRVQELLRSATDYPNNPPPEFPKTGMHFAYTDGGVFQNEPFGLAKQLVDMNDNHLFEQRYYVYVAPEMRDAASNDYDGTSGMSYFNFWNTAKALISAIFNQARYRDLQNAERINDQVELFDTQAAGLLNLYLAGTVSAAMTTPATSPLLATFYPGGAGPNLNADGEAARTRLKQQFDDEYQRLRTQKNAVEADAWIDSILLLEAVAGLGPRDQMTIFAITESADKLAGNDLFAFAGFLDVAYRQHDYDRGRMSVRNFITEINADPRCANPATFLGPIQYNVAALPPLTIDASLDGFKISAMDVNKRQALRDRIYDRIQDFLSEAGLSWVVREAVDIAYLKKMLDDLLGL